MNRSRSQTQREPLFRRQRRVVCGRLAVIPVVMLLFSPGCQQYGEVSPACCQVAMALYSTCNRHDESRLDDIRAIVAQNSAASELTEREAEWLLEIVSTAESGDWTTAAHDTRTMLDDQVTK